jgi:hypothetical protein
MLRGSPFKRSKRRERRGGGDCRSAAAGRVRQSRRFRLHWQDRASCKFHQRPANAERSKRDQPVRLAIRPPWHTRGQSTDMTCRRPPSASQGRRSRRSCHMGTHRRGRRSPTFCRTSHSCSTKVSTPHYWRWQMRREQRTFCCSPRIRKVRAPVGVQPARRRRTAMWCERRTCDWSQPRSRSRTAATTAF